MDDEKKCPRCAEMVKAEAAACRYCQFNFSALPTAPSQEQANRRSSKGGLIALAVIAISAIPMCSHLGESDESAVAETSSSLDPEATASEPPMPVTAKALAKAYEANEMAAQQQYGGRLLAVTGIVDGVDLDMSDDPVVKLDSGQFLAVQAQFDKADGAATAGLVKGQETTVICSELTEVMGTPMLGDCILED